MLHLIHVALHAVTLIANCVLWLSTGRKAEPHMCGGCWGADSREFIFHEHEEQHVCQRESTSSYRWTAIR